MYLVCRLLLEKKKTKIHHTSRPQYLLLLSLHPQPTTAHYTLSLHDALPISSNAANASNEHPAELNDVIKQLQGTLAYKSYSLMASTIQHVKVSGRGSSNSEIGRAHV